MLLDILDKFVGQHQWQTIEVGEYAFCVPDLFWCFKAVFLLLFTYFFIKSFFNLLKTLR